MREEWAADLRDHCLGAEVPFFLKQMGTVWAREHHSGNQKGGDWNDWPEALRMRDYPVALKGGA